MVIKFSKIVCPVCNSRNLTNTNQKKNPDEEMTKIKFHLDIKTGVIIGACDECDHCGESEEFQKE